MVDENVMREGIGLLGTAAAMLIEDGHAAMVVLPSDAASAAALATMLERLGADLQALGCAAAILARCGPQSPMAIDRLQGPRFDPTGLDPSIAI